MKEKWRRKISLLTVFAMLTMCIPASVGTLNVYAETTNKAPSSTSSTVVKVKSVAEKAGKYSVKVGQNTVNYKKSTVTLGNISKLKKAGIRKVRVTAQMKYAGNITKSRTKTVSISKLTSKNNTISYTFPAFGKFTVYVKYYNNKKKVKTVTLKNVGVVASEYNIAAINGTYGNLLFTMSLWDITKSSTGTPVPTIVTLSRPDAYDWNALPSSVYSDPYATSPKKGSFVKKIAAMSGYVKSLRSLNKNSKFHLYIADNYAKGILDIMVKNRIPDSHYDVTMLSDGSGTYSWFNQTFSGSNAAKVNASMEGEWSVVKKAYYNGTKIDCTKLNYSTSSEVTCLSKYACSIAMSSSNVKWWVGRKSGTFVSADTDFLNGAGGALGTMTEKSISGMLTNIQSIGKTSEFKKLFHFSDQMFSAAQKNHKKVMVIMGTRVNLEENFDQFASFIKKYYGTSYEYYYKGHPATPTKLYPDKQKQLDKLGIHDVESSIAAELILFFYPDIYCSGVSNSTLNSSYNPDHLGGYYGVRKANAGSVTAGTNFNFFFTKIGTGEEESISSLCNKDDDNFLVEFKDTTKADIAVYDYTKGSITYYKLNGGAYSEVK